MVNQGEAWLRQVTAPGVVAGRLVVKTLASPLIAVVVAWLSPACTFADIDAEGRGQGA
jgi:hypothetical protein